MNKKRIFIACADERLRIALILLLENEPGMTVVGITDRLESLLPQLEASQANVLLLEWQLTEVALKDLLVQARNLSQLDKIIYFAGDLQDSKQILAAGANHVILKNAPPDELLPILNMYNIKSTNV